MPTASTASLPRAGHRAGPLCRRPEGRRSPTSSWAAARTAATVCSTATEDGIRTRAYDESKMTDPSLIIYHPVRMVGRGPGGHQRRPDRYHPGLSAGGPYLCRGLAHPLRLSQTPPTIPPGSPAYSTPGRQLQAVHFEVRRRKPRTATCRHFYEYDAPAGWRGPVHPHLSGERRPPALL